MFVCALSFQLILIALVAAIILPGAVFSVQNSNCYQLASWRNFSHLLDWYSVEHCFHLGDFVGFC